MIRGPHRNAFVISVLQGRSWLCRPQLSGSVHAKVQKTSCEDTCLMIGYEVVLQWCKQRSGAYVAKAPLEEVCYKVTSMQCLRLWLCDGECASCFTTLARIPAICWVGSLLTLSHKRWLLKCMVRQCDLSLSIVFVHVPVQRTASTRQLTPSDNRFPQPSSKHAMFTRFPDISVVEECGSFSQRI